MNSAKRNRHGDRRLKPSSLSPLGFEENSSPPFAPDSPVEGTGFEPSVPRDTTNLSSRLWLVPANRKVGAKENRHTKRRALPPRNRWFESCSPQRRVQCEPDFRGRVP